MLLSGKPLGDHMLRRSFVLLAVIVGCSDQGPPPMGNIAFRPDAASCEGTAEVDLFIDGTKVGTAALAAGATSVSYEVSPGHHIAAATVIESASQWDDVSVDVPNGQTITVILYCTTLRPWALNESTVQNYLRFPVDLLVPVTGGKTVAGNSSLVVKWGQSSTLQWQVHSATYSDGTPVADDAPVVASTLTPNGIIAFTATMQGQSYFTFDISNHSGVDVVLGIADDNGNPYSQSVRCLATLPARPAAYSFGYYRLYPTIFSEAQVRVYRAASGCTGTYVYWGSTQLASRNPDNGFISLTLDTAP